VADRERPAGDADDDEVPAEEETGRDDSTRWAEFRTDLAEDRTIQATERTFAGWMRTAFAAIGVGIAFHVVFGEFRPPWLAQAIATLFILVGMMVAWTAERRACATFKRLSTHEVVRLRTPSIRWMSWSVVLGGLALIAGLWILNDGRIGGA
jgi:putative membrane protein